MTCQLLFESKVLFGADRCPLLNHATENTSKQNALRPLYILQHSTETSVNFPLLSAIQLYHTQPSHLARL